MKSEEMNWKDRPAAGLDATVGTVVIRMHGHGVQDRAEIGILLGLLGHSLGYLDYMGGWAIKHRRVGPSVEGPCLRKSAAASAPMAPILERPQRS